MRNLNRQQRHAIWVERLERFAAADVTVAEFCRRERVSVPSFYAWRKRAALASSAKAGSAQGVAGESKFLPLVVSGMAVPPMLMLPGGATIELSSQLGRRQLVDLIAAVVEATNAPRGTREEA